MSAREWLADVAAEITETAGDVAMTVTDLYAGIRDGIPRVVHWLRTDFGRYNRMVYVCHPYGGDRERNVKKVRAICLGLLDGGKLPVAPHLYLPQLLDMVEGHNAAMFRHALIAACSAMYVYGRPKDMTFEMHSELSSARRLGLRIVHVAQ